MVLGEWAGSGFDVAAPGGGFGRGFEVEKLSHVEKFLSGGCVIPKLDRDLIVAKRVLGAQGEVTTRHDAGELILEHKFVEVAHDRGDTGRLDGRDAEGVVDVGLERLGEALESSHVDRPEHDAVGVSDVGFMGVVQKECFGSEDPDVIVGVDVSENRAGAEYAVLGDTVWLFAMPEKTRNAREGDGDVAKINRRLVDVEVFDAMAVVGVPRFAAHRSLRSAALRVTGDG